MTYTSTLTTAVAMQQEQRDTVNTLVGQYMAAGGEIERIPTGTSGYEHGRPKWLLNRQQLRNAKAREQQRRAEEARFEMEGDPRMCGDRWLETGKP